MMLNAECGMRNLVPSAYECGSASAGYAECGIKKNKARTPNSELRTANAACPRMVLSRAPRIRNGFTYTALLAAIVIIGITLGSAAKYWSNVSLRDKEEELLFRGEQYRLAIERYYYGIPGRNQYPQSIDDLLKDSRSSGGKRYLRQKYKDPITGEDFVEDRDPLSKRILGVHSSSDKEPLKKGNFPDQYRDFEGKSKYSEWKFQFLPQGRIPPPGGLITNPSKSDWRR